MSTCSSIFTLRYHDLQWHASKRGFSAGTLYVFVAVVDVGRMTFWQFFIYCANQATTSVLLPNSKPVINDTRLVSMHVSSEEWWHCSDSRTASDGILQCSTLKHKEHYSKSWSTTLHIRHATVCANAHAGKNFYMTKNRVYGESVSSATVTWLLVL